MSRFVTGVADLVKEECRRTMLHNDMNLSRLMVYAKSIENFKLGRISRNLKSGTKAEQNQHMFKKRAPIQDGPSTPKVKLEKGSGSQNNKSTCVTCVKRHYVKCLVALVIILDVVRST